MVGIADHGPAIPGGPHYYYFGSCYLVPKRMNGIEVRFGAEANIISKDGELDLPTFIMEKLDFVGAGFHVDTGYNGNSKEDNTNALIAVMESNYVDFITHPGNPAFPVDVELVVQAAVRTGVALEINNSSLTTTRPGSEEICLEIARLMAKLGGNVILGSDSHISCDVGKLAAAQALAEKAGLKEEQILNTSIERLERFLARRRNRR